MEGVGSKMVYAVDFDNTIVESDFPIILRGKDKVINRLRKLHKEGHTIILNTCRVGKHLEEAKEWCINNNVPIDYYNENCEEMLKQYHNDCRKISADYYIDDKNLSIEDFINGK